MSTEIRSTTAGSASLGRSFSVAAAGVTMLLLASAGYCAPLATATVELRDVELTWSAEGVVEAIRQATVAAQVPGRIVEMRVDAGQSVARGQVLARIDEREAVQALAASEAQVARAQADFSNARLGLERSRRLVEQKFISQAALDKAQADFDTASAQLAATRAGVGQASTVRGYTVITAPFSGIVAARHADLGDMAQPGRPLFTLYEPKGLRAVVSVPQARLASIRSESRSASVTIELPGNAGRLSARKVTVLPAADAQTHTTSVRLDLPEGAQGAYPGMFARAHFAIGRAKKLIVPSAAVVRRSEITGAYVVDAGGAVQFRQLRLGEPAGEAGIEVLAGLAAGEQVALDPLLAFTQLKTAARK